MRFLSDTRATNLVRAHTGACLLLLVSGVTAQQLPQRDGQIHTGVASCASSLCHGAVNAGSAYEILQNEYVTWSRHDRHATAYETLLTDESARIARNLGLTNAYESRICLECHADYVPADKQGDRFQLADGVGCEACHGGAEMWLQSHIEPGADHTTNVANGLFPVDQPDARAELCLSCHYGTDRKFVTHRILGAGHPRLSFELDTFTRLQPSHFRDDQSYRRRKPGTARTRVWAMGVLASGQHFVATLQSARFLKARLLPELALFDCHACHHSLATVRWQPRARTGTLGPGSVRLNDSSLLMALAVAAVIAPEIGNRLGDEIEALHEASANDLEAVAAAAGRIERLLEETMSVAGRHKFSPADADRLFGELIVLGVDGEFYDYVSAEQATMAIDLLASAAGNRYAAQIDRLFEAVQDEDDYRPEQYIQVLRTFPVD